MVCCQQFSLWLCRIAKSGRKNPDLAIRVKHKEENSFIFRIAGPRRFKKRPGHVNNIVWLAVLVQQTGNRLLGWINFRGEPGCDDADVTAAMLIVHAWSSSDPGVKGTQAHVQ